MRSEHRESCASLSATWTVGAMPASPTVSQCQLVLQQEGVQTLPSTASGMLRSVPRRRHVARPRPALRQQRLLRKSLCLLVQAERMLLQLCIA